MAIRHRVFYPSSSFRGSRTSCSLLWGDLLQITVAGAVGLNVPTPSNDMT